MNTRISFLRKLSTYGFLVLLVLATSYVALADPTGPETTEISNERRTFGTTGTQIDAQAGNVTALNIEAEQLTEGWQGFYGNITGTIVLDNANNQSFYRWDIASPQGEVFASNSSAVNWSSVTCANFSNDGTQQGLNETGLNAKYGFSDTDSDDFGQTFNETFAGTFDVGSVTIDNTDQCPMVNLFNGSGNDANWEEVILTDSGHSVIFTSVLENGLNAFDNSSADFQILVAEDGHGGDTTATSYFLYVELT